MKQVNYILSDLINSSLKTMLLLVTFYQVIFFLILLPLLNQCIVLAMFFSDISYITSKNLIPFISSPPTILLLSLFLLFYLFFLMVKMTTLVSYCIQTKEYEGENLLTIIIHGFSKTIHGLNSAGLPLLLYNFLLTLFTQLPCLTMITLYSRIHTGTGTSDASFTKGLLILSYLFLGFIVLRTIFLLPVCLSHNCKFVAALEHSKDLLHQQTGKVTAKFLLFHVLLIIGFYFIYLIVIIVAALLVYLLSDKPLRVPVFLSIQPGINLYSMIGFNMAATLMNVKMLSSFYLNNQSKCPDSNHHTASAHDLKPPGFMRKHRSAVIYASLFLALTGMFHCYLTIRNDSLYLKEALTGIQICSHRGNSHVAPENTLSSLENAMIARSDYAEIDIRQTKDGELILLHDENLWRTTGVNKNVADLTLQEIKKLDAGSWFGSEFAGITIPTLEEAMKFCKGKIKLNIDIKNSSNPTMLTKLSSLIKKYHYEHQCVITSGDLASLSTIKKLNPAIKTGYILSAVFGDFYTNQDVDFFSIQSAFISSHVVDTAHKAGKEVYAWTVNKTQEIERMNSLGVDCIITDKPTLAIETLYINHTNQSLLELINHILSHRSFYTYARAGGSAYPLAGPKKILQIRSIAVSRSFIYSAS